MADADRHIRQRRHRVQLPDGKQVEIIYRDLRPLHGSSGSEAACAEQAPAAEGPSPVADQGGASGAIHISDVRDIPDAGQTPQAPERPEPLHICFNCRSELVFPLDWVEAGERHWRILLRCPECEAHREGVFEQDIVERLDDELERAANRLLDELRQVTYANMSDEIDFFVRALDADLVVPSDFHR
jgi:hypothetical protein